MICDATSPGLQLFSKKTRKHFLGEDLIHHIGLRAPLPFWWPQTQGVRVAGPGMTYCPCLTHDPGGVVTGPGRAR